MFLIQLFRQLLVVVNDVERIRPTVLQACHELLPHRPPDDNNTPVQLLLPQLLFRARIPWRHPAPVCRAIQNQV